MKLKPLGDRVIIRLLEQDEQKRGNIIIPDTAKERPQEGEVVAVGPGKRNPKGDRVELDVKKGDRVLFGKYSGSEINLEDEKYLVVKEDEIIAIC